MAIQQVVGILRQGSRVMLKFEIGNLFPYQVLIYKISLNVCQKLILLNFNLIRLIIAIRKHVKGITAPTF